MMKLLLSCALLLTTSLAMAECVEPPAPELPDGETSDLATMVEGQKAVKAYVLATEGEDGYLACLTAEGEAAGEEEAPEAKMARIEKYNAAVGRMEEVANAFNAEIAEFKAKSQ
jgi:hypothetical protein